jgi:hypothetical protein
MIADDFDSIKKALEEIKKEKEREQAAKDSGQKATEAIPDGAAVGGLKGSRALSGIWGNIVWSTNPVVDQQADAQQQPKVADPGHTHSSNQQGSGQTNVPAPQQTTP